MGAIFCFFLCETNANYYGKNCLFELGQICNTDYKGLEGRGGGS